MASYLRPRRGKKATATSQLTASAPLKRGEIFFEGPDTGVGTGTGKIKMGDGTTAYASLPYFMEQPTVDYTNAVVDWTNTTTASSSPNTDNVTYANNIIPSASLKTIFTNLKKLILNYNSQIYTVTNNVAAILSGSSIPPKANECNCARYASSCDFASTSSYAYRTFQADVAGDAVNCLKIDGSRSMTGDINMGTSMIEWEHGAHIGSFVAQNLNFGASKEYEYFMHYGVWNALMWSFYPATNGYVKLGTPENRFDELFLVNRIGFGTGNPLNSANTCEIQANKDTGELQFLTGTTGVNVYRTGTTTMAPIAASAFNVGSSRRYKDNIKDIDDERAKKILDVNVVTFDYTSRCIGNDIAGVIAEDTIDIIPEVVSCIELEGETVPDSVDYSKFVPYLIKMVQIQQKEIDELKNIICSANVD